MIDQGGREEMSTPVGGAATPSVERIRTQHRVTDRDETGHHRLAVDDVVGPFVEQTGHQMDLRGDRLGAAVEPQCSRRKSAGRLVECDRVAEAAPQLVVVRGHGEGHGERAIVADERAVLDVAEVTADRTGAGRKVGIGQQSVEPAGVDDSRVLDRLGHRPGPDRRQPLGDSAPPTVRRHHQIRLDLAPVVEPHPRNHRNHPEILLAVRAGRALRGEFRSWIGVGGGEEGGGGVAGADRDAGFGECGAAQDPLEGGAPAGDHHQFLVLRFGGELHPGREAVAEAHLCGSLGEQSLEDIGLMIAQEIAQPREKGVAVTHLRGAATVPVERFVGRVRHRCVVTFDHGDLVARTSQLQRRSQAGHAAADHHDVHQRNSSPSNSPELRQASMYRKYATGPSG